MEQLERMRAAILSTQCPRPTNAVPREMAMDWTVAACTACEECGCDLGAALLPLKTSNRT
jgi:hypothetical protein